MAVLYLSGVLENGITRSPLVPTNSRMELEIIQHTTAQIIVRVTDPANMPIDSTGSMVLTVKQKPQDEMALAQLTGSWYPLLGPGVAMFSWAKTTMNTLPWGRYIYDVKLTVGAEVNVVIPASPFRLAPAL